MATATVPRTRLVAQATSMFSWNYRVESPQGGERPIRLDVPLGRERGSFRMDGEQYEVSRRGWTGDFVMKRGGTRAASAAKPSAFERRFVVRHSGTKLELVARSPFSSTFHIRSGGRTVGSIRRESLFTRRARITLPEGTPRDLAVFLLWLVVLMWRRAARSA